MPRCLFAFLSTASLLLWVATAVLWAAGHIRPFDLWSAGDARTAGGFRHVRASLGDVVYETVANARTVPASPRASTLMETAGISGREVAGVYVYEYSTSPRTSRTTGPPRPGCPGRSGTTPASG